MTSKLAGQYPELATRLASLDHEAAEELVGQTCAQALERTGFKLADIEPKSAEELRILAAATEEPYLEAIGKNQLTDNHQLLFDQARALNAYAAFQDGDFEDALYEAASAGLDPELLTNHE